MESRRSLAESSGSGRAPTQGVGVGVDYSSTVGGSRPGGMPVPEKSPRPPSISLTDLHTHNNRPGAGGGGGSGTTKTTPIVDNFLSIIPMGHEKAMKYAFYNVLAMILSGFLLFMLWGVYCVLNPFLKSLLWAVLVGSVLYPFKKSMSSSTRTWLQTVKSSSTPFIIRLIVSPIVMVDNISDVIGNYVVQFWKSTVGALGLFLITYLVYYNPPTMVLTIGHFFGSLLWSILHWSLTWIVNWPVVLALNVVYVGHLVTLRMKRGSEGPQVPATPAAADAGLGTDKVDTGTSAAAVPSTPPEPAASTPQTSQKLASQILPYAALVITFIYVCLNLLPYSVLLGLIVFIIVGIISYLQGNGGKSTTTGGNSRADDGSAAAVNATANILPSISRYAALVVMNIGGGGGTPLSGSGGFSSTPRGSLTSTPRLTAEEKRARMTKSWSEGSTGSGGGAGGGLPADGRAMSREPSERSIQEVNGEGEDSFNSVSADADDTLDGSSSEFALDSNMFLSAVFVICVIVQIWNHPYIIHFLPLPLVYYGIKKLCLKFGLNSYLDTKIRQPIKEFLRKGQAASGSSSSTGTGTDEDEDANKVRPLHLFLRVLSAADRKLVSICEDCLDPVSSILILVLVSMATVLGIIFMATQVYSEGDHLVRVSASLVNSTVSQYPEINELLPDGWQSIMSSMVGNAYLYGRETITNMIRDSIAEKNPEKAEQIERQLIELWDKIYETWNHTWENAFPDQILATSKVTGGIGGATGGKAVDWDELLETGKEMPNLLELSVLTNYAKANVGTLWAILESVWNILIGNISLVFSAVTSVVSVVFGGGTAILNFIINFFIFFTALFYLLSSSIDVYKPVEFFNLLSPSGGKSSRSQTTGFAKAVEEAVNGVFAASFKMAAFYGMWTWLIHTLFQVNIVFLPSIFGALFGAVPILAPYCAALPAVLELWLIQGHWPKALFMFLAQMAPMSMVDTQIYSEIKGGGHPYLTGLAIAGGIFYFGFQGAIMGPVILCCVFVAIKVGSSFIREDDRSAAGGGGEAVSSSTSDKTIKAK